MHIVKYCACKDLFKGSSLEAMLKAFFISCMLACVAFQACIGCFGLLPAKQLSWSPAVPPDTHLLGSESLGLHVLQQIPGATYSESRRAWAVPCTISTFPNVTFEFFKRNCSIPPSLYVGQVCPLLIHHVQKWDIRIALSNNSGEDRCPASFWYSLQ